MRGSGSVATSKNVGLDEKKEQDEVDVVDDEPDDLDTVDDGDDVWQSRTQQ